MGKILVIAMIASFYLLQTVAAHKEANAGSLRESGTPVPNQCDHRRLCRTPNRDGTQCRCMPAYQPPVMTYTEYKPKYPAQVRAKADQKGSYGIYDGVCNCGASGIKPYCIC